MPATFNIGNAFNQLTPSSVPEGDWGVADVPFTVTRSGDLSGVAGVSWVVRPYGDNPVDGSDFVVGGKLPSGAITFDPGQTTRTIIVPVQGDLFHEQIEGFTVNLVNPSANTTLGDSEGVGLIDGRDYTLGVSTVTFELAESTDGARTTFKFTVDRQSDGNAGFSAGWRVLGSGSNPASPDDFLGGVYPSGSVDFSASQMSANIEVVVLGDRIAEADEGFTVRLQDNWTGLTVGPRDASAIVRNDDPLPQSTNPTLTPSMSYLAQSHHGQVIRLYDTMLDRLAEQAGFDYYVRILDLRAQSLRGLVDNFQNSPEFQAKYGNSTDAQFVQQLYANVLERSGSDYEVSWYTDRLASGAFDRGSVAMGFSESPEHQRMVSQEYGITWT